MSVWKNLLAVLLVGFLWSAQSQCEAGKEITIHVSKHGDDSHAGTKQQPFLTLPRAQQQVREQIAAGLTSPIRVMLHGGVYELSETLTFKTEDSGTADHSICYSAMPGERVIVSGGRTIKNWKRFAAGHWTADLKEVREGKWFFRQLAVSERRATRARWPNEEGKLFAETVSPDVKRFTFDQPIIGEHFEEQETELVVYQNWSVTRGLVTTSNSEALTTATPMGWIGHGPATVTSPGKPVFLEHAMSFLDRPGEWFLDRESGKLHYLTEEDSPPREVVAPVLSKLVEIAGTAKSPVRNLHFEGIEFAHADFPLPEIGYNEIQACHYGTTLHGPTFVQPVAIECTYTANCKFANCRIAHVNCSGIGLGVGCQDNRLHRCTLEEIGGCGVMIGWRGKGKLSVGREGQLDADWHNQNDVPAGNVVSDCVIRRCGSDSVGGTGLFVAFSKDTRVVRNEIHDLPYTGISVGYRWSTEPTSQSNCLVEANHIYDVMQKLADGGGIYTLGLQPGTVLRANSIHDVHRSPFAHGGAPNNGFFLDQGSKGFLLENNVVRQTSGEPIRFNQCQRDWHTWSENYLGDQAATSSAAELIIRRAGPSKK